MTNNARLLTKVTVELVTFGRARLNLARDGIVTVALTFSACGFEMRHGAQLKVKYGRYDNVTRHGR